MFILIILFWIFVPEVQGGYYFVIAPNVIRFEQDETVVVSVFGETYAYVKLWIEHEGKQFSMKNVVVKDQETPIYTTIKVQEADIFDSVVDKKPRVVKLCSEWKGTKRSREIILSYHSGYLIVQTDKPIYTPKQRVKIRALALDESLKANDGWQVGMDIISPSILTMGRRLINNSVTGFFQNEFTLPPYPEMGIWTARAFYDGQFETESHTHFEVRENVLPTFGVTVDVDVELLLPTTKSITVTVKAKYVYGKPVNGNARLTLKLKGENKESDFILNVDRITLENNYQFEGSVTEFSIKVDDILNSPLLRGKPFPSNKRLEVIVMVYESATGKEEARSHDGTIFTRNPYVVKFTKSKLNFWPYYEYYLKVEVQYVNGKPTSGKDLIVRMSENGQFKNEQKVTTNDDGRATCIFQTSGINKISFTVATSDNQIEYESDVFEVAAYAGKNLIQVEPVKTEGNIMWMRAFTNIQWNYYGFSSTGMLFMVISRGKVVYTKYKEAANVANEEITKDLQEFVSPDARLLVFYVDKTTNELVADSIKFEVDKKCRGRGLRLQTMKREVMPATRGMLTVTGTPFMHVGLNIIDKALLLQNDKNVLRKNKMFEILQSHDLGCGEGGGRSGADVFKKTGLTVLTNSYLDENDIVRTTAGCKGNTRKRRDAYEQLDEKSEYLEDIARLEDHGIRSYTRDEYRESWMFDVFSLDKYGQMQIKLMVPDSITEWKIQAIGITENDGMCIADEVELKSFRDFFIQLDLPFKATRFEQFNVKATIFNYDVPVGDNKVANVYLHGVPHLCSNGDPGKPSTPIKIELKPNSEKTVTFPIIPLRNGLYPVKISAITTDIGIPSVDVVEKKLYVVNEGIEEKVTIVVCLDPMRQKDDCKNDRRVLYDYQASKDLRLYEIDLTLPSNSISQTGAATAYIQSSVMSNVVDTIIKGVDSLFQHHVGFGEQTIIRLATNVYALTYLKKTKQMTADKERIGYQRIRDGVKRQVSQYRHADGSYVFKGIRQPSTWLTAFVAKVFCQADKVVDDAVDVEKDLKPSIDWLNKHVNADGYVTDNMPEIPREMMGQIGERDSSLTAFVLITLHECGSASGIISTIVDKSVQYLEGLSERKLKNNPFLLAITTYALSLSDSTKTNTFVQYLKDIKKISSEGTFWGNPGGRPANAHSVETTSYALLAMLHSGDMDTSSSIVSWLTSQRDGTGSFRTTQDTVVGLQALSKYKIATFSPGIDLRITLLVDNLDGREVYIDEKQGVVQFIVPNIPVETGNNTLSVVVQGSGSAVMSIDLRYNRPATEEESCPFTITDIDVQDVEDIPIDINLAKERNCDVCGNCDSGDYAYYDDVNSDYFGDQPDIDPREKSTFGRKKRYVYRRFRATVKLQCIRFSVSAKSDKTYGMSIVKFGLETGVEVVKSDLDKLVADKANIAYYEMPSDGKGFILFYLHEISSSETRFIFRLKDNFDVEISSRQPSSVYVYDYYNPEKHCTKLYGTGPDRGNSFSYQCDRNKKECACVQNICAQPVEKEIKLLYERRRKPALKFYRYACNTDKANYAVVVTINEVDFDVATQDKIARGTVMTSLNQGIEDLQKGDTLTFFWKSYCHFPDLEEGKAYMIIGKDGHKFYDGENERFRYPLMGTTLVMEYRSPRQSRVLYTAQTNFKRLISRGCRH